MPPPLCARAQAILNATDPGTHDFYGRSVALSGGTSIVGAFRDDDAGTSSGSAYVYECPADDAAADAAAAAARRRARVA